MNKNKFILITSLFILVILLLSQKEINVLEITKEDKIKNYISLNAEEKFSIIWEHSVEKEEWEEFFDIKEKKIFLTSTRFKTFGAGVPSEFENSYIKDGWLYVPNLNREIGELSIRAGKETNHRLINGKDVYVLSDKEINSISYHIKKKRITIFDFYINNFIGGRT